MHSEHLTYNVSYKGGWVALWTPAATAGGGGLKAMSTVTPRASTAWNPAEKDPHAGDLPEE